MQQIRRTLTARVAALILGTLANLFFLAVAARVLDTQDLGRLVVASNLALFVQSLDLGVAALFVNKASRSNARQRQLRLTPFIFVLTMVAAGISIFSFSATVALDVTLGGELWPHREDQLILLSTCLIGGASTVSNLLNARLLALDRPSLYYLFQAAQPLALILVATAAIFSDPPLVVLAIAAAAAGMLPGVAALVAQRRLPKLPKVARTASAREEVLLIFREALPLGIRQSASLVGFGLIPTLVGASAGPQTVVLYAVPAKGYLSAWSVVGVASTSNWRLMANQVADAPSSAQSLATRINLLGATLGLVLGACLAGVLPWVNELVAGVSSDETMAVALYLSAALALRGTYLGWSLGATAIGGSVRFGIVSIVLATIAACAIVVTACASTWAASAVIVAYTVLDMTITGSYWRSTIKRRSSS